MTDVINGMDLGDMNHKVCALNMDSEVVELFSCQLSVSIR